MNTLNTKDDVAVFLKAAGQSVNTTSVIETWHDDPQAVLYKKLCDEEFAELHEAWAAADVVEVADAIADLIWVLQGLALSTGIPMQEVWNEVSRSNLAKIDKTTGLVPKRADGKVMKPEGWTPPQIAEILNRYTKV